MGCKVTALLASANIVLGSNRVYEAVAKHLTNKDQHSAIEAALISAGYTPVQAKYYLNNAEALVGIADVAAGGVLAIKGVHGLVTVKPIGGGEKRGATGNNYVDDFVDARAGGNPSTNVDAEPGNLFAREGRLFNALELEDFAPTLAQRNSTRLSDGSLIDNHGFVCTRIANGSVTSRVANQDQLSLSGVRLDYDNISTANARQSATPRNQNEQLAFDCVRANPQIASAQGLIARLNSNDARFSANGFEKFHQSVPGPNGQNISVQYQFNPTTGRIADMKVTSSLSHAQ